MSPQERGHVAGVLHEAAGPRERTVDDHMFAVEGAASPPATFRLQLFTAPHRRPVAVATQSGMEGPSLTNAAEQYLAAVWQRHFPDDAASPEWRHSCSPPTGP